MTTFSRVNEQARPAPKIVTLSPSCFADAWHRKPAEPMECGLRLVSEGDMERVRFSALRFAQSAVDEGGQDRVDTFNDAIMRMLLSHAMCMPNDVREPFFELPEENVREALTEDAVKFLWHQYDVLKTESCNYLQEADDDDLAELSMLLMDAEAWEKLPMPKYKRLRRIALHLLEELDPELRY